MLQVNILELVIAFISVAGACSGFVYLVVRNMYKDQNEFLKERITEITNSNRKYKIQTTEIPLNKLCEVTEISNSMVIEIPQKHNIKIFSSYIKPNNSDFLKEMHEIRGLNDNFAKFEVIARYLYLQYDGDDLSHLIAKGFSIKEI
jgi:hypothetical protein